MRILIENYRNWEIHFDTEREEFYCLSNQYDTDKTKRTFAAAKSYIDDYIKTNSEFKQFEVMNLNHTKIKVIGVRKDRLFMIEKNGEKETLSKYNEKDYFLIDKANEPIFAEIEKLEIILNDTRNKLGTLRESLIRKTIADIKFDIFNKYGI